MIRHLQTIRRRKTASILKQKKFIETKYTLNFPIYPKSYKEQSEVRKWSLDTELRLGKQEGRGPARTSFCYLEQMALGLLGPNNSYQFLNGYYILAAMLEDFPGGSDG